MILKGREEIVGANNTYNELGYTFCIISRFTIEIKYNGESERAYAAVCPTRWLAFHCFSAMISISKSSVDNLSFRLKAPSFAP
jgi:hypothetical protein